jgi:hypothetical protein
MQDNSRLYEERLGSLCASLHCSGATTGRGFLFPPCYFSPSRRPEPCVFAWTRAADPLAYPGLEPGSFRTRNVGRSRLKAGTSEAAPGLVTPA